MLTMCSHSSRINRQQPPQNFNSHCLNFSWEIPSTVLKNVENSELLEKILSLELDEPEAQLPFTARLAREQRWTHVYAGRVIIEYKYFIALAMLAGHPVTPSEEVDQAWHLHLLYTRSYWHHLCRDILGRELHHGPTYGGSEENSKFLDWYARTLASYESLFLSKPPPDIWPAPRERFTNAGKTVWVNAAAHWIIPKPFR